MMDNQMTDERAEFEAWASEYFPGSESLARTANGTYLWTRVRYIWDAWQAARCAPVAAPAACGSAKPASETSETRMDTGFAASAKVGADIAEKAGNAQVKE